MKWSDFNSKLNDLLAVERRRLGAQPFIDLQVRLAVGDVQRCLDYYRFGITSTYDLDDLQADGFASKGKLPAGANLREAYHVKTGKLWVRRPLREYVFSNRNDLRAGAVTINCGGTDFYFCVDHRTKDFWVYPLVTSGYAVQLVWDAVLGRGNVEYDADDEVPFDEPVVQLTYDWVKMRLSVEVDKDPKTAQLHDALYRKGISSLFSETQERLRLKHDISEAGCVQQSCWCHQTPCCCLPITTCGNQTFTPEGSPCPCPEITMPQTSWVMFGDSGEQASIQSTIAVATAVKASDPEFIVHLGDATHPSPTARPGDAGTVIPSVPASAGGAQHLLNDLLLKHYWNFIQTSRFYLAFGERDLETDYGRPTLGVLGNVADLIGEANVQNNLLMYDFAYGPVRFFVLNSGLNDADTKINLETQISWLTGRLAAAAEPWAIAVFHRPAYTSDSLYHPGSALMKTLTDQLAGMGIDLVVCAHGRNYERFVDATGLQHIICGLGGATPRGAAQPITVTGSQIFYSSECGFVHFTADTESLMFEFRNVRNEVIDRTVLRKYPAAPVVTPPPVGTTQVILWGSSAATSLTEAQVLALSKSLSKETVAGAYTFDAVGGDGQYMYFAWPDDFDLHPRATDGFKADGFAMVGDWASDSQGYTQTENGWNYQLVTVSGEPHRIYRTLYRQQTSVAIEVAI